MTSTPMERVSLTLFGALLCVGSFAQPGSLDTGFGNGGTLTTDFGIPSAEATAIAQLPDGRLLVAGYTNAGANYDPALAMYLPNGDLDPSFGEGGLVSVSLDVAAAIHTLAVRPDGRILIAGSAAGSEDGNAIVLQFLPDGTLDPDLGSMGYVTHSIPGGVVSPRAMVLRPDGGLVLTGNHFVGTVSHLMFIALHADGTPDETFGTDGHATFLPTANNNVANAMVIQPDGRLVLCGSASGSGSSGNAALLMARILPDGSPDESFGDAGFVIRDVQYPSFAAANALVLEPDGRITSTGSVGGSFAPDAFLMRLLADGTPDPSLDDDGFISQELGAYDFMFGMVRQPDGRYVIGGWGGSTSSFCLARLNADGSLDTSFTDGDPNNAGPVVTPFGTSISIANALVLQTDGKVVACGRGDNTFALARYNTGVVSSVSTHTAFKALPCWPTLVCDQEQVNVDLRDLHGKWNYRVLDMRARVLINDSWSAGGINKLDVSQLDAGSYLLELHSTDGDMRTARFVRE